MNIIMKPIGFAYTDEEGEIPRHWTVSDFEGRLVLHEDYLEGMKDLQAGQRVVVIFYIDRSPEFTPDHLVQTPKHRGQPKGVFSLCSPIRPNPIGMSILDVLAVENNIVRVRGIDMLDGTPILDIKPYIELTFP